MIRSRCATRSSRLLLAAAVLLGTWVPAAAQSPAWSSAGPFCALPNEVVAGPTPTAAAYLVVRGRLFRSTDGWLSWQEIGCGAPVAIGSVASVAADPVDPRRLLCLLRSRGVHRSVDAGESWVPALEGLPGFLNASLWSPPAPRGTFFAVDLSLGVFKTTDFGAHWRRIDPPQTSLPYRLFPPGTVPPGRLWLRTDLLEPELWRSDDLGESWQQVAGGLPEGGVSTVAADPARPPVTYLTRANELWRSDDAIHWTPLGEIPADTPAIYALLVLPGDPAILLAGQNGDPGSSTSEGPGLLRSDDGGLTWMPGGLLGETVYDLRYVPESGWAVALTGSGAFVSRDRGGSWHRIGRGVSAAAVLAVETVGNGHGRLLASVDGCDGPRIARSDDGGRSWRLDAGLAVDPPGPVAVVDFAAAPSHPRTVYAAAEKNVWRSLDAGESWQRLELGGSGFREVRDLAVHPTDPDVVFAASSERGLARSDDGGLTWQLGLLDPLGIEVVFAVAIDPHDPLRMLAGGVEGMARSLDGGVSWSAVPELEQSLVEELAIDPSSTDTILAVTPFGQTALMRSTDGGATWQPAGAGFGFERPKALAVLPAESAVVLAGTLSGVYRSEDGGDTWSHWKEAAGHIQILDMTVDPLGRVFAATLGQGVLSPAVPGAAEGCRSGPNTACLLDGAFEVRGAMWDFGHPTGLRALAVMDFPGGRAESDQAVFFESFAEGNFELGVKMVNACGLPPGDPLRAYWAFVGGLTNAASEVVIEDPVAGGELRWNNPAGTFPRTFGDTGAFPCIAGTPPEPCLHDGGTACLLGGRFRVTGVMHDFSDPPREVPARVMHFAAGRAESDQAVFFESFAPGNFEVGVKMVDACGLPVGDPLRAYWAFYGGLTNAEAQIVVTQIATGRTDAWSNGGGTFPRSEGRTAAFPCAD